MVHEPAMSTAELAEDYTVWPMFARGSRAILAYYVAINDE
jgi:hypothetical protein